MSESDFLAHQFELHRPHLRSVAHRLLGSTGEAEDAVQETWLRLSRTGAAGVDNLGGWLTTAVARVALNMLRSRSTRREEPLAEPVGASTDPEAEALLADSVGVALLVVVDNLGPAERLAFVLHDLFAVPFEEIAPIVGRSPAATRQLASRARRRVQGAAPGDSDLVRRGEVVEAFMAASRGGDFQALLALLDPDVELRADRAAVLTGASALVRGAERVAQTFSGRARAARIALVDGEPGAVWSAEGRPRVVFRFTVRGGRITAVELIADLERLSRMEILR